MHTLSARHVPPSLGNSDLNVFKVQFPNVVEEQHPPKMATCSASFSSHSKRTYPTSTNINLLPTELLVLILLLVVSSSSSKPGSTQKSHLALVCRYWRQIIFENPNFWTTVSFRKRCFSNPDYMELVLRNTSSKEKLVLLGPGPGDVELDDESWIAFHEFLRTNPSRIETLILDSTPIYSELEADTDEESEEPEPVLEGLFPGLENLVFENLQVISIVCDGAWPIDFQIVTPNLQALQINAYLCSLPHRLPFHLKKFSFRAAYDDGLLDLLHGIKELEYLSIFFKDSYGIQNTLYRTDLPKLTTLKANSCVDLSSAPALTHIELAAPQSFRPSNPRNVCRLVDGVDLSKFTHLYVGYTCSYRMPTIHRGLGHLENPIDGCIWASIGPAEIPCLSDRPTIFKPQDLKVNELPSAWFNSDGPDDEPRFHVHVPGAYSFVKDCIILPCKFVSQMVSLETLVLCFPETPYPPRHDAQDDLKPYDFHLTDLFSVVAHPRSGLRHLVIRSGGFKLNDLKMLSECFDEEIWTKGSCTLLESITYHAPSPSPHFFFRSSRHEFWTVWINFIVLRKECGYPLKLLRIIGAFPPSSEVLKKLEELPEFTKVVVEDADDTAYHDVELEFPSRRRLIVSSKLKCYPSRGF